jgi:hypothetical protein
MTDNWFKGGIFLNCVTRVTEWLLWIGSTKGENLDEEMRLTDGNRISSTECLNQPHKVARFKSSLISSGFPRKSNLVSAHGIDKEECVIGKFIHNFG